MEALISHDEATLKGKIKPQLLVVSTTKDVMHLYPDSVFWITVGDETLYIYRVYSTERTQLVAAYAKGEWAWVKGEDKD